MTARVLRYLASHHIFHEELPLTSSNDPADDRFAHSRLSAALDSGAPLEDVLSPGGLRNYKRLGNDKEIHVEEQIAEEETYDAATKRWERKFGRQDKGAALGAYISFQCVRLSRFSFIQLND
jgi:hypothetical protein